MHPTPPAATGLIVFVLLYLTLVAVPVAGLSVRPALHYALLALLGIGLSAGPNPLSDRERDVLHAAADGATVADIAGRLHLSGSTVRNYLSAAIGKTSTRNRIEAEHRAKSNGWI